MPAFLEPALQRIAEKAVQKVLNKRGGRLHASQAALVAMRTDGRVVAMVGGKDWEASHFNRAVQARRASGAYDACRALPANSGRDRDDAISVPETASYEHGKALLTVFKFRSMPRRSLSEAERRFKALLPYLEASTISAMDRPNPGVNAEDRYGDEYNDQSKPLSDEACYHDRPLLRFH